MGLDMYLVRKKYIGAKYEHRQVKGKVEIEIAGKKLPIEFDKISYIEEDVGYWRKANAIHKWFVDNVQDGNDDCREYYVDIDKLEELLNICKEIKEKAILKDGKVHNGSKIENGKWVPIMEEGKIIINPEICEELLPTEEGFFFGGTEYDEYYMQDIEYTIELLENLLEEENKLVEQGFYSSFYYRASW